MKIYEEFLAKVKSASHTNNLGKFVEKLASKMGAQVRYDKGVLGVLKRNDPKVLQVLREETQLVALLMREKIEMKRSQKDGEEDYADCLF